MVMKNNTCCTDLCFLVPLLTRVPLTRLGKGKTTAIDGAGLNPLENR